MREMDKKNTALKTALDNNELALTRELLTNGANIQAILKTEKELESFRLNCSDELSRYLELYSYDNEDTPIESCLNELSCALFGKFYVKRGFQFNIINKIKTWKTGLTEIESKNSNFISSLLQIINVQPWEDRHANIDLGNLNGNYLVVTKKNLFTSRMDLNRLVEVTDKYVNSPNIDAILTFYNCDNFELKNLLANITFNGSEVLLGISQSETECYFENDGRINSKIFDSMKNIVSSIYKK